MFRRVWNVIRRHKKKVFVVGGIIGGTFLLRRYLGSKLREWENRRTKDFLDQMKHFHHFDGTVQTCDSTIQALAPKIRETIASLLKIDDLIEQLKFKPANKLDLWEELKILIVTSAVSEMCSEILLVLFLRVQLCIIGGYIYLDMQREQIQATPDIQQKYLASIHHFFNSSIEDLLRQIRDAVQPIVGNLSLKKRLLLKDFQSTLECIKHTLLSENHGVLPRVGEFLLSSDALDLSVLSLQNGNQSNDVFYQKVLLETRDVLESADFEKVFRASVEKSFALLMDRISECFVHLNQTNNNFVNPHSVAIPLAKVLPVFHTSFQQHLPQEPNSNVQQLLQMDVLKTFSANVYEAFSQPTVDHSNVHEVEGD